MKQLLSRIGLVVAISLTLLLTGNQPTLALGIGTSKCSPFLVSGQYFPGCTLQQVGDKNCLNYRWSCTSRPPETIKHFYPVTSYPTPSTVKCPVYDVAHPPYGYRYQCTKDANNCQRCLLKYVSTLQTTDTRSCSPNECEGSVTVRTCSNGTVLYPVCKRQTDGRCVRSTPQCPNDRNVPKYNYENLWNLNNKRVFPEPLSNCSVTPPANLPNCQYICTDNEIGRCPTCRYVCSSYPSITASPVTSPEQNIALPYILQQGDDMHQYTR